MVFISHLIYGLLDLRFLSFTAGEDEVSPEGPDKLELLPQAVRLCLDGLQERGNNMVRDSLRSHLKSLHEKIHHVAFIFW